jgi:hypothetical protein
VLPRDTQIWGRLRHAYGSAGDIPGLLNQLEECVVLPARWQEEPLRSLTQALCHQRGTANASYAAVPHLVDIAAGRPPTERGAVLHLVGAIAAYAELGPPIPKELRSGYETALRRGVGVVAETLDTIRPAVLRQGLVLLADLAACRGATRLARAIVELEPGEVEVQCRCGRREMLGVAEDGIEIEPLKWCRRPSATGPDESTLAADALELGLAACARVLSDLEGSIECPSCKSELELLAGIARAN